MRLWPEVAASRVCDGMWSRFWRVEKFFVVLTFAFEIHNWRKTKNICQSSILMPYANLHA